jgi:hypothetical protein
MSIVSVAADNCLMTSIASISLLYPFSAATIASSEKSRILCNALEA